MRQETLDAIQGDPAPEVLILGGGVNGIGLLRELSLQGIRCLLVERDDFTSGASSKSSRMIHGGLRYLENAEFRLVRESLAERNRLLENAPHYVAPLRTTIPFFSWLGGMLRSPLVFFGLPVKPGARGAIVTKIGLWLYDFFTRRSRRTPVHHLSSRRRTLEEVPGIHPGIVASATYWDACITQAERLCIEMLQDALAAGAGSRAINYASVARGAEDAPVVLRDAVDGREIELRPAIVVNATGAWVDAANRALGVETGYMGGTKGSHLVVENEALRRALDDRMVYYQHHDGRVCIAFEFLGKVIMGSTDLPIDDPDQAECDDAEVDYMIDTLRGVLPGVEVSRDQVLYKFCGVRPLPASDSGVTARISRDHAIETSPPAPGRSWPLLSLVGGKWTTFRALAEQTTDRVLELLGRSRRSSTDGEAIGGGRDFPTSADSRRAWVARVASEASLPPERVESLLERYGTAAEAYATAWGETGERPLRHLPGHSREEIERIAREEWVEHLDDLVCRRSLIALLGQATPEALEELADVAGAALGWDEARRSEEVARARAIAAP